MKKMAYGLVLCMAVALGCSFVGDAAREEFSTTELKREYFIGRWQDYPLLGNGWSTNLNFYEDGTYIYHGHCEEIQRYEGTWSIEDNQLVVTLASADLLIGANLIRGDGGSWLRGGRDIELQLEPPVELRYGIKDLDLHYDDDNEAMEPYYDSGEGPGKPIMYFGGVPYWRIFDRPVARWTPVSRELIVGQWTDEWDAWGGATYGETEQSHYYRVGGIVPDDATLTFLAFRADGTCALGFRHIKTYDTGGLTRSVVPPLGDQLYEGTWALDETKSYILHIQLTRHETLTGAQLVRKPDGFEFVGGTREEQPLGALAAFDYIIYEFGHFDNFEDDNPQAPLRGSFNSYDKDELHAGYLQRIP